MIGLTSSQLRVVTSAVHMVPVEKRDLYLQRISAMLTLRGRGHYNDRDVMEVAQLALVGLAHLGMTVENVWRVDATTLALIADGRLHNRAGFHAERSQRTTAGATALPGPIHIDRGLSRTGLPMLFPARLLGDIFQKRLILLE
jgi:hypothetical protein